MQNLDLQQLPLGGSRGLIAELAREGGGERSACPLAINKWAVPRQGRGEDQPNDKTRARNPDKEDSKARERPSDAAGKDPLSLSTAKGWTAKGTRISKREVEQQNGKGKAQTEETSALFEQVLRVMGLVHLPRSSDRPAVQRSAHWLWGVI